MAERWVHATQAAAAATTTGRGPDTLQGLYPGPDKEGPQHKPGTRHHHNLAGARADALPKPAQVQAAGVGAAAVATQVETNVGTDLSGVAGAGQLWPTGSHASNPGCLRLTSACAKMCRGWATHQRGRGSRVDG